MQKENDKIKTTQHRKIPIKTDSPAPKTLEIKITLPFLFRKRLTKKIILCIAIGALLITVGIIYLLVRQSEQKQIASNGVETQITAINIGKGTPEYTTILPAEKTIESLGGWTRVSPPKANPVFAYLDTVNNTPINVSQQPLPEDFKDDISEKVESLAQEYGASQKITVEGVPVYIGTSAKGPQSVIFSKNDLLVLIKSSVEISNDHWAQYISSLR